MRVLRALAAAILLGIAAPAPASADSVYAYWSYWQGDTGTWKYATVGPATAPAIDGAVDGWRFTLGSDGRASQPATTPDFATVCGGTPDRVGSVRVAVVIDFAGLADGGPSARCAVVEQGLSRASALTAVAALRLKNGFVCGIDGLPANGCGDEVETTVSTATAAPATTPRATASAVVPPDATAEPEEPRAADSDAPRATATPALAPTSISTTESETSQRSVGVEGSPLATVLTFVLGGIAVALALRNARRQLGQ